MYPSTLILNLNAERLRKQPALADEVRLLTARRGQLFVTRNLDELEHAARKSAASGARQVLLGGGDGTYMAGLSALARAYGESDLPELVLAPAGTVATVARNFGQRGALLSIVKRMLSGSASTSIQRPTLRVRDPDNGERLGFIFGTGLVARFFDRYYAAGAGGHGAALRIVLRVFLGSFRADAYAKSVLTPLPCRLTVDGRALEHSAYSLVVASVVRDLGLHLLVTHRAGEEFERPHLVASALETSELGPQVGRVLRGRPLKGKPNFDGLVSKAELDFGAEPGPYVLDGDVLYGRSVALSAGPRIRVRCY